MASSIALAQGGVSRVWHWGFGDNNFGNGEKICAKPLSRCGLYGSNMFVAAAAGHVFQDGRASILETTSARPQTNESTFASGLGSVVEAERQVRLLISVFSANKTNHEPVEVRVEIPVAPFAGNAPLCGSTLTLDHSNSVYVSMTKII